MQLCVCVCGGVLSPGRDRKTQGALSASSRQLMQACCPAGMPWPVALECGRASVSGDLPSVAGLEQSRPRPQSRPHTRAPFVQGASQRPSHCLEGRRATEPVPQTPAFPAGQKRGWLHGRRCWREATAPAPAASRRLCCFGGARGVALGHPRPCEWDIGGDTPRWHVRGWPKCRGATSSRGTVAPVLGVPIPHL